MKTTTQYRSVLTRLSKWLVVLALMFSIGAHWALLQSVAWAGMILSYTQESSFSVALIKTFDGQRPCCLCKLVQEGKATEKKQERKKPESKADKSMPVRPEFIMIRDSFALVLPCYLFNSPSRFDDPPTPPPRAV